MNPSSSVRWIFVAIGLIGIGVVCSLLTPNDRNPQMEQTAENLTRFAAYLVHYGSEHAGRLPEGDTASAAKILMKEVPATAIGNSGPLDIRDGWGRLLLYEWLDGGYRVRVWSSGVNGRDERGGGDDLLKEVDNRPVAARGETPSRPLVRSERDRSRFP